MTHRRITARRSSCIWTWRGQRHAIRCRTTSWFVFTHCAETPGERFDLAATMITDSDAILKVTGNLRLGYPRVALQPWGGEPEGDFRAQSRCLVGEHAA